MKVCSRILSPSVARGIAIVCVAVFAFSAHPAQAGINVWTDDVVTLVNIALGSAQPSACPDGGLPLGGEVDVAVIIQAVTNALNGCGVGT